MDPIDREVLVLRHFEQLSNGECARVLGLGESAATKRYLRALRRLKDILSALPGGDEGGLVMNGGSTARAGRRSPGPGRRVVSGPVPSRRTAGADRADRTPSRAGRADPRVDPGTGRAGAARRLDRRASIQSPAHRTGTSESGDEGPSPERLGDYLILRRIGGGGMGVVYEAEHESLKSRVALKVMHPRFRADPKYLRRFHAEARLAAGLHHTNIVSVFDYGDQDGVCYYAMQFIKGQPLDRVLADIRRLRDEGTHADGHRGPDAIFTIPAAAAAAPPSAAARGLLTGRFAAPTRPVAVTAATGEADRRPIRARSRASRDRRPAGPGRLSRSVMSPSTLGSSSLGGSGELRYFREIARVGAQVADALEYAHRRGVLHRDIKPSNLLLDALGNVWVTDFGLAKLEEGDDLSQSRELVGTLRYMAPERFRGTSDRRGDIYSLGATLYELLALRPPFEESDQIRLIERIRNDAPAPPRQLDRNIPRDLETIVLKALAKDPKDRFGSAGELADELRRFVEGRPIRSRPVSVVERFWRWCKRDPWLAGANIAAALLTTSWPSCRRPRPIVYRNQRRGGCRSSAVARTRRRSTPAGARSTPTRRKPAPGGSAAGPASDSRASRR